MLATTGNEVAKPGGFAEYAILEADPAFVSFDEAASFPLLAYRGPSRYRNY